MNDTTRQMGGALGVAVIGSILATTYRPGVTDALTSIGAPADVITKAQDSVGARCRRRPRCRRRWRRRHRRRPERVRRRLRRCPPRGRRGGGHRRRRRVLVPAGPGPRRPRAGRRTLDGIASLTFAEAEGVLEEDAAASPMYAKATRRRGRVASGPAGDRASAERRLVGGAGR
jgi:hypothetical protein